MYKQSRNQLKESLNSISIILNEIYHTISTTENTQKNESVESLLSDMNCIYSDMELYTNDSSQTIVSNAAKIINQYYIDLITKAILKNNIICTQILITQAPSCCCLEFRYPSIDAPEIEIIINSKSYSINIIDAKITDQFLSSLLELRQMQKAKEIYKSPSVLHNGLFSKYMMQWLEYSSPITRAAIDKDKINQQDPDRRVNEHGSESREPAVFI